VFCLSRVRAIVGFSYNLIRRVSLPIGAGPCVRGIDLLTARNSERDQNWNSIHNRQLVGLVPRGDERDRHAVNSWRRYCAGSIDHDLQRGVPQDDGDKNRKSIGRRGLDNWRMPWLAELPPSELSYASRIWMGIAGGLVLFADHQSRRNSLTCYHNWRFYADYPPHREALPWFRVCP
jgi:hypothetical protein